MPNAAIIGAAMNTATAKARSLWLGGIDVLRQPGGGTIYGVDPATITVTERGAGGVSSIAFTVEDPGQNVVLAESMPILFWDNTNDVPIFVGWVDQYSALPDFGDQARSYEVSGVGPEALLDWMVNSADVTFAAGTAIEPCIQALVGMAYGVGWPIRAFASNGASTIANPIQLTAFFLQDAVTVSAGTSLREGIRQICDGSFFQYTDVDPAGTLRWTVDMYFGLRLWLTSYSGSVDLSLNDGAAGTFKMSNLSYDVDSTVPRQVFVKGGNAAGTGVVSTGSGFVGPIATFSDTTIDTTQKMQSAGAGYLQSFSSALRGQFTLENVDPASLISGTARFCTGGTVTLTLSTTGLSARQYPVYQMERRFVRGTTENVTVNFGGMAPTMTGLVRRLTRNVRA